MMEKSLHSGMDIKQLQEEWDNFLTLQFPKHSDTDQGLYDLFVELVSVDYRMAGAITTLLDGEKTQRNWLLVNEDLNHKLEAAKPNDSEALKDWQALKERKERIDKLAKMALAYYDQKYGKA